MKSPSRFGRQPNVLYREAIRKSSQGAKRYLTVKYFQLEENDKECFIKERY